MNNLEHRSFEWIRNIQIPSIKNKSFLNRHNKPKEHNNGPENSKNLQSEIFERQFPPVLTLTFLYLPTTMLWPLKNQQIPKYRVWPISRDIYGTSANPILRYIFVYNIAVSLSFQKRKLHWYWGFFGTMASALFIVDMKGKPLIQRIYRGDVPTTVSPCSWSRTPSPHPNNRGLFLDFGKGNSCLSLISPSQIPWIVYEWLLLPNDSSPVIFLLFHQCECILFRTSA